jgi:hypothetical protein
MNSCSGGGDRGTGASAGDLSGQLGPRHGPQRVPFETGQP